MKREWLVEIYQRYCSPAPEILVPAGLSDAIMTHGEFDSEILIMELQLSAQTVQEASDKGWRYIEEEKIPDAVVHGVYPKVVKRITIITEGVDPAELEFAEGMSSDGKVDPAPMEFADEVESDEE